MPISVKIIHPDRILFEGQADYLLAPGRKGILGIMPGHTPMFAELVKGEIYIAGPNEQIVALESGILKVRSDIVTVLVTPSD